MDQSLNNVVARLQQLASLNGGDSVPDRELLERYTSQRDSAAVELLIWRYGSMVLATCRRMLGNGPDAEDAFQATFLVLVRKAHAVRGQSVAAWLHRVACNTCLRLRKRQALQSRSEAAAARPDRIGSTPEPIDWQPILDDEIARLPQRFRSAFLLCHFEGKTNDEAARLLGVPKGTLLSRLARARQRLKHRLIQRGLAPAACAAAFDAASEPASAALVNSTLQMIGSNSSATPGAIAGLAEGVIREMNWIKIKLVACVFAAVAVIGAGGILLRQPGAQAGPEPPAKAAEKPKRQVTDLDLMQGSWLITSLIARGREQEESGVARLVIKGDVAGFIKRPGKTPDEFKLKLDSSAEPPAIDFIESGKPMHGIYELDGDNLKICYFDRGTTRPKSFDVTKEGRQAVLMILKREQPERKPQRDPNKPEAKTNGQGPLDLLLPKKTLPMVAKDEYEMHGAWSVVEIVADGQQRDPGDMRIQFGPFQTMTVQDLSLDKYPKPLSFKLHPDSGAIELRAGGKTQFGIYRLANNGELSGTNVNHLNICVNEKSDKPPKEFTAAKGSGNILFQLRRQSYAADTKWGEKLFPGGLVIDFGKVTGNEPKAAKVRIKNPYSMPVWIYAPMAGKWLAMKWLNHSGPIEPGEEALFEFTLQPGFLPIVGDPLNGNVMLPQDAIQIQTSLKNYRPKTDPLPSALDPTGQAMGGQPVSVVFLNLRAEFGESRSK